MARPKKKYMVITERRYGDEIYSEKEFKEKKKNAKKIQKDKSEDYKPNTDKFW